MSPLFISSLKRKLKCRICSALKEEARKFCAKHLALAREKWHQHVAKQLAKGRCVNCWRPHLPFQQRCAICKEANRAKCRAWSKAHYHERTTAYVQKRQCPRCPEHRPLKDGAFYCEICNAKKQAKDRINVVMHALFLREAGLPLRTNTAAALNAAILN